MAVPVFAQRVARLPGLLAVAANYPDGITLGDLARRFDTTPQQLREDLTTYLDLESWGWTFDIFLRSQVEFAPPEGERGEDVDEAETVVRVVHTDPTGLGAEHLAAADLAAIYTAGVALLDVEPDNADLAAALEIISETMYGVAQAAPQVPHWNRFVIPLQQARKEQQRVRIRYSRAWHAGVFDRVVEPLALVQTHRGWELDAGPVGPEGNLRTYLLTGVRDVEALDETFEPPANAAALLEAQRRTTRVRMELAQDARWAADMYAERVTPVSGTDDTFVADLDLLPPVGVRVGLLVLAGGSAARVLQPAALVADASALIDELIAHHEA